MKESRKGEIIGIVVSGGTREIKYEQVREAIESISDHANILKRLGKKVPEYMEITLKILSFAQPM